MNIALPALVIFACLIPGFIFRSSLKLVESTSLDYSPFGRVVSESALWAAVLHALWIGFFCPLYGDRADLGLVLKLLSSNLTIHGEALNKVTQQVERVAFYFCTLYIAAYIVPFCIRRAITICRVDRYDHWLSWLFRFHGAPWYYLLTGADFKSEDCPDYIIATAIVEVAGQAFLFKGVLESFYFKSDGTLDRLILEDTSRRKLSTDSENEEGETPDATAIEYERFYPIEGDSFVIQYDQTITLNIQYVKLTHVDESGQPISVETNPKDVA